MKEARRLELAEQLRELARARTEEQVRQLTGGPSTPLDPLLSAKRVGAQDHMAQSLAETQRTELSEARLKEPQPRPRPRTEGRGEAGPVQSGDREGWPWTVW